MRHGLRENSQRRTCVEEEEGRGWYVWSVLSVSCGPWESWYGRGGEDGLGTTHTAKRTAGAPTHYPPHRTQGQVRHLRHIIEGGALVL